MSKGNKKIMLKKIVAIIGIVALIINLILFGLQKISMKTFFYTIGFFGILAFLYYKKEKQVET